MRQLLLAAVIAIAATGCGGPSAEQAALDRIKNRPKPGYVRILNLRDGPATLLSGERPVNPDVQPGGSGKLAPDGVGKRNLFVEYSGQRTKLDVSLVSGEGHTIVLVPGNYFVVGAEPVKPVDGKNLRVTFVDKSGGEIKSGKSVTVKTAEGEKTATAGGDVLDVVSGNVSCLGVSHTFEPNFAYTLIVVVDKGSMRPYFMLNTANDRPVAAGTASG